MRRNPGCTFPDSAALHPGYLLINESRWRIEAEHPLPSVAILYIDRVAIDLEPADVLAAAGAVDRRRQSQDRDARRNLCPGAIRQCEVLDITYRAGPVLYRVGLVVEMRSENIHECNLPRGQMFEPFGVLVLPCGPDRILGCHQGAGDRVGGCF